MYLANSLKKRLVDSIFVKLFVGKGNSSRLLVIKRMHY